MSGCSLKDSRETLCAAVTFVVKLIKTSFACAMGMGNVVHKLNVVKNCDC